LNKLGRGHQNQQQQKKRQHEQKMEKVQEPELRKVEELELELEKLQEEELELNLQLSCQKSNLSLLVFLSKVGGTLHKAEHEYGWDVLEVPMYNFTLSCLFFLSFVFVNQRKQPG
jgi:uncharacterized protein involved in type VI secretion and phage assembly